MARRQRGLYRSEVAATGARDTKGQKKKHGLKKLSLAMAGRGDYRSEVSATGARDVKKQRTKRNRKNRKKHILVIRIREPAR